MNRLTERDEMGNVNATGIDSAQFWLHVPHEVDQAVSNVLNNLAAYEDSGLSPQEVKLLAQFHKAGRYQG